jgi:hypothetical protein
MIKNGSRAIVLILFGKKRNCKSSRKGQSLYLFIRTAIKIDCSNYKGISVLSTTYTVLSNVLP